MTNQLSFSLAAFQNQAQMIQELSERVEELTQEIAELKRRLSVSMRTPTTLRRLRTRSCTER
ncbi:MAG: hypothetical protein ACRDF4_08380 [Rhabdochlamydiaceae bacterium]